MGQDYHEARAPQGNPSDGERDVWFDNGEIKFGHYDITLPTNGNRWVVDRIEKWDGDEYPDYTTWTPVGAYGSSEQIRYASDHWQSNTEDPLSFTVGVRTGDITFKGYAETASGMTSTEEILFFDEPFDSMLFDMQSVPVLARETTTSGTVVHDLQSYLNKQQQTLQMISNINKILRDTTIATIRNIGG